MIPEFTNQGDLPEGIHLCSGVDFLDRFLFNEYRKQLLKSISDIFDWSKDRRVKRLFIGGSFITDKAEPNDFDCVIVFAIESQIPRRAEVLTILTTRIDVQFCAESDRDVVDTYLHLFSYSRGNDALGIVEIDLYSTSDPWKIRHFPSGEECEIIQRAYINRHYIDHYEPTGILVTIHGVLSDARWNATIAPIASSQKWIFAPFIYLNENTPELLIDGSKAKAVIEDFRSWIYDIYRRYDSSISIIAHSFGTYILGTYICGFDEFLPIELNCVILTGSILTADFDWDRHKGVRVGRVLNEIAPNDQWVKHMPKLKWLTNDPLYGDSGVIGFNKKSSILIQKSNDIFDHSNVIKRDIIERHWMPFLTANRHSKRIEGDEFLINKFKNT